LQHNFGVQRLKVIEISGREFVTAASLAMLLNLNKRTVLTWAHKHEMPFIAIGNMRLFDVADLGSWLDGHKRDTFK
jgi:excisionase family DNA binding protein